MSKQYQNQKQKWMDLGRQEAEIEFANKIRELKEKLWEHEGRFEGIKCKTCLPLDWVEDLIDEVFGEKLCEVEK